MFSANAICHPVLLKSRIHAHNQPAVGVPKVAVKPASAEAEAVAEEKVVEETAAEAVGANAPAPDQGKLPRAEMKRTIKRTIKR